MPVASTPPTSAEEPAARAESPAEQEAVEQYKQTLARHSETMPAEQLETISSASVDIAELLLSAFERNQEPLRRLSPKRRAWVGDAIEQIAELLTERAVQPDVSAAQLQDQSQAAVDAFRIIAHGNVRQLQSVIDALDPVPVEDPDKLDQEEAQARGRLRLQALYQKLLRESFSVAELRSELGLSRQRLKQLRDARQLFALSVPYQRGMVYPHWQFDPNTARPRDIMPRLLAESEEARLDEIDLHQLMTNPEAANGVTLVQLLDGGREDLVLGVIRAGGQ
jgi:hypothetical protein